MAQRIKPEDLPFDVPKFSKDEFVRKELISFKTTAVLFGVTLVAAVLTFFVWKATGIAFFPLLLIAMLPTLALKPLYRALRIDIGNWGRKEWVGTYLLYFFFWLGFTLLAFNPPFQDTSAPAIDVAAAPAVQDEGMPVQFTALVRDNQDLDEASVTFCLHKIDGAPPASYDDLTAEAQAACAVEWTKDDDLWSFRWDDTDGAAGDYAWFVRASDTAGRTAEANGTITIGTPYTVLTPARTDGVPTFDEATDLLIVRTPIAKERLLAVRYEIGGEAYNMDWDAERGQWFTSPDYPGWTHGENVVTIEAIEQPKYLNGKEIVPPPSRAQNATYTVGVDDALPSKGSLKEPAYERARAPDRIATPGLGLPLIVAGLAAAVVAARRRD